MQEVGWELLPLPHQAGVSAETAPLLFPLQLECEPLTVSSRCFPRGMQLLPCLLGLPGLGAAPPGQPGPSCLAPN